MGEGTDKTSQSLKQKLSQHIDAAKSKLDALRKDVDGMHAEDMQALQEHREAIQQRLDQQKDRARKTQEDISRWKQEKVAHTQEAVGTWRQRRELKKLQSRADRAEDYAVDMVTVAAYDFDEAEQAVLDAIAARYEAEQAAAPTS